ncbi:MAG TPA: tRNA dihydrouridine synthase DusB, partial [Steroidobacteraceae bacterium]|nr:tRNA dihydrouridine synthase DusB [Steroidobacteraceae bacterium]
MRTTRAGAAPAERVHFVDLTNNASFMIRIGPHVLDSNVLLAPMAGVTDRPFRVIARRFGAGLAASEMITSDVRLWTTKKTRARMNHEGEPVPRVVQLAGADPQALAEAARRNIDLGAQIIDINMGCPAKKVCNRLCGSALLTDEALVAQILQRVVAASSVPVTLKMRTGFTRDARNGVRIAQLAESCGIAALAVHGRTREDFYDGEAEYETIREIRSRIGIPLFANGDIDGAQKARAVLDFTGATGVMLGRAAHGSPWIFRDVNFFLIHGKNAPALPLQKICDTILAHLESLYDFYGEETGVRVARKHLGWYFGKLQDAPDVRRELMAAATSASQFALSKKS